MADSTNSGATAPASGTDLSSSAIGNLIGGAAQGNVANTQLGNATGNENSAISTLQSIEQEIAGSLPPNLTALAQPLAQLLYVGNYNPDQIQGEIQAISKTAGVTLDPATLAAQKQALTKFQAIANNGYSPQARAQILQTMNSIQAQTQGGNSAILQQLQQQGQGGPINSLAARLINQQQGAISAAASGSNIASAQQTAQIGAEGTAAGLAGTIQGQESGLALTQAQAQDAINQNNASLAQQANLANQTAQNTAKGQQQNINASLETQNVQNQLEGQQQKISAAATQQGLVNQNLGLQEGNAVAQAGTETGYGLQQQQAGLTNQTGAASKNAQGVSQLVNGLVNSGSSSSSTPSASSSAPTTSTDLTNLGSSGGTDLGAGFKDGGTFEKDGNVVGPGGPREDKINAKLSNGEFVTNAEATDKYRPVLHAINDGAKPGEVVSLLAKLVGAKKQNSKPRSAFEAMADYA